MNGSKILKGRIYGRFSSAPQEKGTSRERQIIETRRWANNNSIEIIGDPFFDEAVSGKDGENLSKELGKIISQSKSGEYILCEEIDRLGRQNPIELCAIIHQIVRKGVVIVATKNNQIINSENINEIAILLPLFTGATVGYVENTRKIKRLRDTNEICIKNALNGKQSPTLAKYLSKSCFGWDKKTSQIIIKQDKADLIRKIFKMYNDGLGVTSICQELNTLGIPTFYKDKKNENKVKPWMETSVRKILRNKSYSGQLELNGSIITCIPSIVEPEVFQLTQYLIEKNKGRRGNNTGRTNNLFRNIGKCIYCNGSINVNVSPQSKGRKNNSYGYRCINARLKKCKHPHKILNAKLVEPLFFQSYFDGSPESFFSEDHKKLEKEKDILNNKLVKIQEVISNLLDIAETGNKQAKQRIQKKEQEILEVENEIKLIEEKLINRPQNVSIYNELSKEIDPNEDSDPENESGLNLEEKQRIRKFIYDHHKNMMEKLNDIDLRKKISYAMQSLFDSVVFDCVNGTIQGINKDGVPLRLIKISKKDLLFQKQI